MMRSDLNRSKDILNRVMIKDNIAVIVLLEDKQDGSKILVSNAHLHWDPLFSDVKVIQTALLIDEIQALAKQWATLYNESSIPVLICGDFNSLPDSGGVEFLNKGHLPENHKELEQFNYHPFTEGGLNHQFNLKSADSLVLKFEEVNR